MAGRPSPGGFPFPEMATAILIDGDFFIRRLRFLVGKQTAQKAASDLHWMCREHLRQNERKRELYPIFFYDCPPLTKKVHNPITGKAVDFGNTATAVWRAAFHDELRKLRKVALRLGYLNERMGHWSIRPEKLKDLLGGRITVRDLAEGDVLYAVQQKGVDMRIGLDIASLAYKKLVDQIILVAGDSDFVPAAKMARREGIDFILDPMWGTIRPDLHEHIDGLRSVIQRPAASTSSPLQPRDSSQDGVSQAGN
jgi:uncharacterized LabA/DUF88 family protein